MPVTKADSANRRCAFTDPGDQPRHAAPGGGPGRCRLAMFGQSADVGGQLGGGGPGLLSEVRCGYEECGYRMATAPTGEPAAPVIFSGVPASMNSSRPSAAHPADSASRSNISPRARPMWTMAT